MTHTSFDLIALGRCGVDFYAEQVGARLEDANSFAKYIGGSSTNIAACAARQGLRSALISRVGDEHMGRFLREQLQREGVDVRALHTDPERPTAMVVLGIKDRDTFPLVFVRENCADMGLVNEDVDPELIKSAKCLVITGTHFSTEQVHKVSSHALALARQHGLRTALDIDYRPVLWGLTARGDGQTRFIASDAVSQHLQNILPQFDLVIGTEEEIHIAGGSTDTLSALRQIRAISQATIVLKRGPYGATVFAGAIPERLEQGISVPGVNVDVLNVLGAGDAFAAGFLRGWLNDEGYEAALRYANACGALVVSRHGCTPAMPTVPELDYYLAHADTIARPDRDRVLNQLHRVTTRQRRQARSAVLVHAFDHRAQCVELARSVGADLSRISALKALLLQATEEVCARENLADRCGILCDDTYGQDVLNAATGKDWWIARPVEVPGSRPLALEGGPSIGSRLKTWPLEHIVKCLVFYHPDDEADLRHQQELQLLSLWQACQQSGHELLLEIIPPAGTQDIDEAVQRAILRLYNLEIFPDWWKLPGLKSQTLAAIEALIDERDPYCHGIVILGLDAPIDALRRGFAECRGHDKVRGFAVGRSIFAQPAGRWLADDIDDQTLIEQVSNNYQQVIQAWRERSA